MSLDKTLQKTNAAIEEAAKTAVTAGNIAPENADQAPKGSFWAKFWIGFGFSTILAKFSLLGGVLDLNRAIGAELPFKEKLKTAIHPRQLFNKLGEAVEYEQEHAGRSKWGARANVGKYTLGSYLAANAIGFALGAWRGDRIEKASDLIHHPLRSIKLILGLEAPASSPASEAPTMTQPTEIAPEPQAQLHPTTHWRDKYAAHADHVSALAQAVGDAQMKAL